MKYVRDKKDPKLENKNVISILISSDFLGMANLVEECIKYIQEKLSDVVRFPIDLSCLNSTILTRLAQIVPLEQLGPLRDRRDKLSSKLYQKKLELMIQNEMNPVYKCVYCHKLYSNL